MRACYGVCISTLTVWIFKQTLPFNLVSPRWKCGQVIRFRQGVAQWCRGLRLDCCRRRAWTKTSPWWRNIINDCTIFQFNSFWSIWLHPSVPNERNRTILKTSGKCRIAWQPRTWISLFKFYISSHKSYLLECQ